MPTYPVPLTHRPTRDGQPVLAAHVPFYLAMEAASDAWGRAIEESCAGVLGPRDVAVVNATGEFHRELFVGESVMAVTLAALGSSSLHFEIEISQNGRPAGTVTAVVCRVNRARTAAVPLSEAQRAALGSLLLDSTDAAGSEVVR